MAEAQSTSGNGAADGNSSYSRQLSESYTDRCGTDDEVGESSKHCTSDEGSVRGRAASKGQRRRQKVTNKDSLVCQVCSDKANGYNFGAVTCESCKAFFRRNALKHKDFKCPFDGNCKIDPFTRKFCTACRLKVCSDINMKKEWILDEASLKKRKKLSRRSVDEPSSNGLQVSEEHIAGSERETTARGGRAVAIADSCSKVQSLPASSSLPPFVSVSSLSCVTEKWRQTTSFASSCEAPTSSEDGCSAIDVSVTSVPVLLSAEDNVTLSNIMQNHGFTVTPLEHHAFSKLAGAQPTQPHDSFNMADGFIRRLIKFVKTIPEFSCLNQDDQIALLKGGIMETLVIRSAITYDPGIDGYKLAAAGSYESRDLKISMIFRSLGEDILKEHTKFITSFNAIAKSNKTILVVAMIINLFSPDRPGLSAATKAAVAKAEDRYSQLLQRYLGSLYSPYEAEAMYPRILMKLTDVRSYGEMSARQVAHADAHDLEPLMREIFNLS